MGFFRLAATAADAMLLISLDNKVMPPKTVKTELDPIQILTADFESSSKSVRTLLRFSRLLHRTETFICAVLISINFHSVRQVGEL